MNLNDSQQQAIGYTEGPLLIVAGAGTGKTTVITQKIAYLIEKKLAKPEEILALTFTEKAAGEMSERVDKLVQLGYVEMQISTFHAFCERILQKYALDIGIPNQFNLLTEIDAWLLVRKNLDKFNLDYYRPLGNPARYIHELIKHFSKCKDELIAPEDYLQYAEENKLNTDDLQNGSIKSKIKLKSGEEKEIETGRLKEVAEAYHTYNQLLLDNNSLDFGDLIFYTIKLLEKRPQILRAMQNQFKYILVDEFQDVNWAQYYLVQKICDKNAQLTVVGDDDQSVYAFRGASVSNILRFKDDFPSAKEVVLTENYRSEQEILDAAYNLIQNNNPDRLEIKLKINKKLKATKKQEPKLKSAKAVAVTHLYLSTLDEEIEKVVDEILKLKEQQPDNSWGDFAILVRANNHAVPFINIFQKRGIPFEFLASTGLYRQPIVLDCLNFFKVITDYHESGAVWRLLNLPFLNFSATDLHKFSSGCRKKSISFYEGLKRVQEFFLSKESLVIVENVLQIIHEGMQKSRYDKPTTVLYGFLEKSNYLKYLTREEEQGEKKTLQQIRELRQFFDTLADWEKNIPDAKVRDWLEHFEYLSQAGDKGEFRAVTESTEAVNILTVHSAKGLEFRYVFMVNLVEDRFPSRDRGEPIEIPLALVKEQLPEGDSHIEEERRLFYVAMTRAKERLYLVSANDYGGARVKKISRFLNELGYSDTVAKKNNENNFFTPISLVSKSESKALDLPDSFSFSQIKSYSTCPYQYKLAYILKIPTKGNAAFSFGQTMHSTLQEFYQQVQELNKVEQASLFGPTVVETNKKGMPKVPTLEGLLSIYEKKWLEDWYMSKKQREEYFAEGKNILKVFYAAQKDNWTVPVALESGFKIKVSDFTVGGRIDRIDRLIDGTLKIFDYKTGKAKEKVIGNDKDQLLIYQIATEKLPEYNQLGCPSSLTYIYLNENKTISFLGTEKEKEELQKKLLSAIQEIHAGNFSATPSQFICDHCDFRDICDWRA